MAKIFEDRLLFEEGVCRWHMTVFYDYLVSITGLSEVVLIYVSFTCLFAIVFLGSFRSDSSTVFLKIQKKLWWGNGVGVVVVGVGGSRDEQIPTN